MKDLVNPSMFRKRSYGLSRDYGLWFRLCDDKQKWLVCLFHKLNGFCYRPKIGRGRAYRDNNEVGKVDKGGCLC